MFSTIRTQAVLLSAVPLSAMLVILFFATAAQQKARETAYWAQHSNAVLNASDALIAQLGSANRYVVQFSVTRDPAAYRNFKAADRTLSAKAATLRQLVADNPVQERRAATLSSVIVQAQSVLERYAKLAQLNDKTAERRLDESAATRRVGPALQDAQKAFNTGERQLAIARFNDFGIKLQALSSVLIVALLSGIGLTILTMTAFGLRIVYRLHHLGENARRLSEGETPIALGGKDEIATLDRQYREMAAAMRHERQIASTLQRALLPQQLPAIDGIRIDSAYVPASEGEQIGGDWYDVFQVTQTLFGFSIGDVAGHGLLAARMMAVLRQSIRTAAQLTQDPGAVLSVVNRLLCDDPDRTIATAFFALLDVETGALQYAVAGHPAPIIVQASGDAALLEGTGMILGVARNQEFPTSQTALGTGSALVLYTDGLVEAERDYDKGMAALFQAVEEEYYNSSGNIASAIQQRIFSAAERRDDSAVLFIGITDLPARSPAQSRTWTLDARDANAARRVKRALLWHLGQAVNGECDLLAIELIFGELLGNVARHTPGDAVVDLEIGGAQATLHVKDWGAPFSLERSDTPDEFDEGGRGLFLIRNLSRGLRVERTDRGNRVSAVLPATISLASI